LHLLLHKREQGVENTRTKPKKRTERIGGGASGSTVILTSGRITERLLRKRTDQETPKP